MSVCSLGREAAVGNKRTLNYTGVVKRRLGKISGVHRITFYDPNVGDYEGIFGSCYWTKGFSLVELRELRDQINEVLSRGGSCGE